MTEVAAAARPSLPPIVQAAAVVAALTIAMAFLQSIFLVRFIARANELLDPAYSVGAAAYLSLVARLGLISAGIWTLAMIFRGPPRARARSILLLNLLILLALLWSLAPLLGGQWREYYESLSLAGKLIFPATRLAVLAWIAFSTRSLWRQAFN